MTDDFPRPGQDDPPHQNQSEQNQPQQNQPHQNYEPPTYEPQPYQPPAYGHRPYEPGPYNPADYNPADYSAPTAPAPFTSYPPPPAAEGGPLPVDEPAQQKSADGRTRTVLIAAVVAAVVGGGIGAATVAIADDNGSSRSSGITVTNQTAANSPKLDGTVTAAAAKITPSVVTIDVTGQNEAGTGSGVILRSDGYILTNNHVVAVAGTSGTIDVLTNDGRTAKATIVGTDASDDLAVIKVSGLTGLTPATFGKSSDLQVGQSVVAVGAPLGLSNTVTAGIVSDLARPVQTGDSSSSTSVFSAIQTDAAINPGNSGGPLVNLNGDVVGIDAAIASTGSGGVTVPGQSTQSGSIGIGFAIPSDEANRIAGELITTGKATHAVIGVTVDNSSSDSTAFGATIAAVTAGSPAAQAGLQPGDVVTKVDGVLMTADVDLVAAVRSYAPGTTIDVTYTRAGKTATTKVTCASASS